MGVQILRTISLRSGFSCNTWFVRFTPLTRPCFVLGARADTVAFHLYFHITQVTQRGQEFGAGNTAHAVALLVSTWRWSSWPAHVFYAQVFVSAFSCLASNMASPLLWRAFVVGRVCNIQFRRDSGLILDTVTFALGPPHGSFLCSWQYFNGQLVAIHRWIGYVVACPRFGV